MKATSETRIMVLKDQTGFGVYVDVAESIVPVEVVEVEKNGEALHPKLNIPYHGLGQASAMLPDRQTVSPGTAKIMITQKDLHVWIP